MILYEPRTRYFNSNGLGILSDAVSGIVTEERNGAYELVVKYPMDGVHFSDIGYDSIITAKPARNKKPQPFRVYRISQPLSGVVTFYAAHASYDLSGEMVGPFTAGTAAAAMTQFRQARLGEGHFTYWTDVTTSARMTNKVPASVRSLLGGKQGSLLDCYGGELEFDGWTVRLHAQRGQNRGVSIRYGKNLLDLQQEKNCSNVVSWVYPYWTDPEATELVVLPEEFLPCAKGIHPERFVPLDLSSSFQAKPTVEQLRGRAKQYIKSNHLDTPKVSLKVKYQDLEQTEEYRGQELLERVDLCDTVTVVFPKLGVNSTAKVVKTVYNVLLDRFDSVELGEPRSTIADTILGQQQEIEEAARQTVTKSYVQAVVNSITSTILGAKGGSVRILDTNDDGEPDTLYIADNPDPVKAVKVWRFNYEGWAASDSGYTGKFKVAATLDQGIYGDFITAGTLTANIIRAGILASMNENFSLNMETGEILIQSGQIRLGKGLQGQYNFVVDDTGRIQATVGEIAGFTLSGKNLVTDDYRLTPKALTFTNEGKDVGSLLLNRNIGNVPDGIAMSLGNDGKVLAWSSTKGLVMHYHADAEGSSRANTLDFDVDVNGRNHVLRGMKLDETTCHPTNGWSGRIKTAGGTEISVNHGYIVGVFGGV